MAKKEPKKEDKPKSGRKGGLGFKPPQRQKCHDCNGTGMVGDKTCDHCHGTGEY